MSTHSNSSAGPGILAAFHTLGDSLLATAQDRLELLGVEVQEEKYRLIHILIWVSAAIFTGVMAITFASLTLVFVFWESARFAVLGGLTLLYSGALIAIIVSLRRFLANMPGPFAATREEFAEDRACIRNQS